MFKSTEPKVRGVISWDDFTSKLVYLQLRPKHKLWIRAYLETGSPIEATKSSYACKNPDSLSSMAYQIKRNPKIVQALEYYFGRSAEWLFDRTLGHLVSAVPGSVAAQRLLVQRERLLAGTPADAVDDLEDDSKPQAARATPTTDAGTFDAPATPKRFKVGDLIVERDELGVEHRGRVLAVDTEGAITDAEEFPT